jgi:hypothetical protein
LARGRQKSPASAGLSLLRTWRSLLLLLTGLVGFRLGVALVLLRIALGLLLIGGRSGLLLDRSGDRSIYDSIDSFKVNLKTHWVLDRHMSCARKNKARRLRNADIFFSSATPPICLDFRSESA